MTDYFLAAGAAWLAATLVALIADKTALSKSQNAAPGLMLEEKTADRRRALYFLGRLALALVLVYGMRAAAPAAAGWQFGLQSGALAGALIYVPLAFEQFARYALPAPMIIGNALSGMIQCTAAGTAAALVLALSE